MAIGDSSKERELGAGKGGGGAPTFSVFKKFFPPFYVVFFPCTHSLISMVCFCLSLTFPPPPLALSHALFTLFTRSVIHSPCVSLAPPSLPPALCQALPVHVTITVQPICSVSQPLVRLSDLLCLDTPTRQRRIPAIHISQVTLSPFCINTVEAKTLPVHGKSLYCDCYRQENMICVPRQISDSRELLIWLKETEKHCRYG